MDNATRERLKKYADAKKGRSTIKGLDTTLGLVALDFVQEQYEDKTLKGARLQECCLEVSDAQGPPWKSVEVKIPKSDVLTRDAQISSWRARGERTYHVPYPWVRLKNSAPWQVEQLVARFPSRRVSFQSYKGPDRGVERETVVVHPLEVVVAFLKFIWPDPFEFGTAAEKYLRGFTEKFVQHYPGLGAKLRVIRTTNHPDKPHMPFFATVVRAYGAVAAGRFGIERDVHLNDGSFEDFDISAGSEWIWDVVG